MRGSPRTLLRWKTAPERGAPPDSIAGHEGSHLTWPLPAECKRAGRSARVADALGVEGSTHPLRTVSHGFNRADRWRSGTGPSASDDHVRKPLDASVSSRDHPHMDLDHAACYRALALRDARFDGRFFIAVKTTGVYCRPVCPARTPRSENVTFYPSAVAAQEAGFRPCLRCRPETAPDIGAWRGTSNTVSRALALIELGALDEGSVDALAGRLGEIG